MKKFKKNLKKGFTIIELAIVIAVIAILAAVLIPTFTGIVNSARESVAYQECRISLTTYISEGKAYDGAKEGMVFVHKEHEYVYVYLDGDLRLAGKFGELCHIDENGTLTDGKNYKELTEDGNELVVFSNKVSFNNEFNLSFNEDSDEDQVELKTREAIYFYTITTEKETYVGYFVMNMALEEDTNSKKIENCICSVKSGAGVDTQLTVSKASA